MRTRMRLYVLGLAAGLAGVFAGFVSCQSASAYPITGNAIGRIAASSIMQAQYYERHGRYGIVKCYRDFVIGRYRCHHYW
jgi:hypothetical protein